jgi:hypothetical protein
MIEFVSGDVWPAITKACRTRGPRSAAIAYLGGRAPELLPLKAGDVLVCDAGDSVLLGHGTSPDALEAFVKRGVDVWSCPGLHAKVLVTATCAVVGSANASENSTGLDEAVIVTDSRAVLASAATFIRQLGGSTRVDALFIDAARATWARGRSAPMAHGPSKLSVQPLLPDTFRLFLAADTDWYTPTAAETAVFQRHARVVRRAAGPAATFSLDSYQLGANDLAFRRGDVLVQVVHADDGRMVWPPVVVISDAISFGRRGQKLHVTRGLADLEPIPLEQALEGFRAAGVTAQLDTERWIRSVAVRNTLLALWDLTSS